MHTSNKDPINNLIVDNWEQTLENIKIAQVERTVAPVASLFATEMLTTVLQKKFEQCEAMMDDARFEINAITKQVFALAVMSTNYPLIMKFLNWQSVDCEKFDVTENDCQILICCCRQLAVNNMKFPESQLSNNILNFHTIYQKIYVIKTLLNDNHTYDIQHCFRLLQPYMIKMNVNILIQLAVEYCNVNAFTALLSIKESINGEKQVEERETNAQRLDINDSLVLLIIRLYKAETSAALIKIFTILVNNSKDLPLTSIDTALLLHTIELHHTSPDFIRTLISPRGLSPIGNNLININKVINYSVENNHASVVDVLLLDSRVQKNLSYQNSETFFLALEKSDVTVVDSLLKCAHVNLYDREESAILIASTRDEPGKYAVVKRLIDDGRLDASSPLRLKNQAMIKAVKRKDSIMIRLLLSSSSVNLFDIEPFTVSSILSNI
jgi:hypothetical protein